MPEQCNRSNFKYSTFVDRVDVHYLDVRSKHRMVNKDGRDVKVGGGKRSTVSSFSRQSRTRLLHKARNVPGLTYMITLTYPHADLSESATGGDYMADGRSVKEHFRRFRQMLTYRGISGLWFVEFQERGAPHFHVITTKPILDLDKVKSTWWKMVGSGCPHHRQMGVNQQKLRKKHAAGAYAAKYGTKAEQKTVPEQYRNIGRFWGYFGPSMSPSVLALCPSQKLVSRLSRLARAAARAQARSGEYSIRVGRRSPTLYNVAPALRYYLSRLYNIPDIQDETRVIRIGSSSLASAHPEWVKTVSTDAPRPKFLRS